MTNCTHLDQIQEVTPSSPGCEDCLADGRHDWVHRTARRHATILT